MSTFEELKQRAWEANLELPKAGLVTKTFGNASAMDPDRKVFAIKPSGVPFESLRPEDMVVVDLQAKVVEGRLRPSSDTRTHAVLYAAWPDIQGIVHTHSLYAVAWAQAMKPIPVLGTTHADYIARDIPCTLPMEDDRIAGDYEEETGKQILNTFRALSHTEVTMVLVACHGPFTWGSSPGKAVEHSIALEQIAQTAFLTLQINSDTPRLKETLLRKHFERKHGSAAYYGQGETGHGRNTR
ncbi:MAG: L-ribulose-5-phosphate 4-epimerase AraD [Bacteroidetes bacterium]|nr:L-ribulose-5-phosphate 4-epimerase AraD [Bacteroidota bacterium]